MIINRYFLEASIINKLIIDIEFSWIVQSVSTLFISLPLIIELVIVLLIFLDFTCVSSELIKLVLIFSINFNFTFYFFKNSQYYSDAEQKKKKKKKKKKLAINLWGKL